MKNKSTKHFSLHEKRQEASITAKKLKQLTQQIHKKSQENLKNYNELEQQRRIGKVVMKNISNSYIKIEDQAQFYVVKLEEERQKYKKLQTIINFCQKQIKSANISPIKTPIFEQSYEENKLQSLIQQYKIKHNKCQAEILKKSQQINNHRKYRTISSKIFDQLQRQLFYLRLYYKQILIQKIKYEDIQKIQTKKLHKLQQLDEQTTQIRCQQEEQIETIVQCNKQNYENELKHLGRIEKHFKQMNSKTKTDRHAKTNRILKKLSAFKKQNLVVQLIHKTEIEKLVKEIFNDLQVSGIEQIRTNTPQSLQKDIKNMFNQIISIDEQIYELQKRAKKTTKIQNIPKNTKKPTQNILNKKKQNLQAIQEQLYISQEQISNFTQQAKSILGTQCLSCEQISDFMENINSKICQYTQHYSIKQEQSYNKQQEHKKQLDKLLDVHRKEKYVKKTSIYTSKDLLEIGQKALIKSRSSITLKKSFKRIDSNAYQKI